MKKEFAVIGLGRFGSSLARTLYELGHSVLGIDSDEEKVHAMMNQITHVVQADATDESVLQSLGLRNFETVVVSIGHDMEASILVTLMVKEVGARHVVAKAATEAHGKVLARVGADRVVFPEKDMGAKVARSLVSNNVLDLIELTPDISIVEITTDAHMTGKSLRQLDLRAKHGVTVLAIKRGREILVPPAADVTLRNNDILVVIGRNDALQRIQERTVD